jgi:hypothetical protein
MVTPFLMHPQAYNFIAQHAAQIGHLGFVFEIGSKNVNGTVRGLFDTDAYLGIDVRSGPDVDVVADGAVYIPPTPPDLIVSCEVLEHTPDAEAIVRHALALLPSGGRLLVTAAAPERAPHSAEDGGPLRAGEFYRGIPAADLECWLAGCAIARVIHHPQCGDVYAMAVKA